MAQDAKWLIIAFAALFVAGIVIGQFTGPEYSPRAAQGASILEKAVQNPATLELPSVLLSDTGAICYVYRTQNYFGVVKEGQAVFTASGTFKMSGMADAAFVPLWKKECKGIGKPVKLTRF